MCAEVLRLLHEAQTTLEDWSTRVTLPLLMLLASFMLVCCRFLLLVCHFC